MVRIINKISTLMYEHVPFDDISARFIFSTGSRNRVLLDIHWNIWSLIALKL